ncbi:SPW repeat-containing protein [Stackebrandtia soli]
MVAAGAGVTVLWFLITMLLAVDLTSTLWVILVASVFAAGAASVLARYGDRGAATGIAAVAGTASAVVGAVVEWHAFVGGAWILW